jgi:hypothetical protein
LDDFVGAAGFDLESDGVVFASVQEFTFNGFEEVGDFLFIDVELAVAGDTEEPATEDAGSGEEVGEVVSDYFSEEDEVAVVVFGFAGELDKSGEDPGELDDGEMLLGFVIAG